MSSYSRSQLEAWLSTLEIRAESVLDVGGVQLPIKSRLKSFDVFQYDILDLPKPHQGTPASVDLLHDLNRALPRPKTAPEQYKVVFCIEVMEYIYDPLTAIQNLYEFTATGGILYISFPFVYPQHEPLDSDYLRYTKRGSIRLLEMAGFKVEEVIPRVTSEPGRLGKFYTGEGMRPSKSPGCNHEEVAYIIKAVK